MIYTVKCMNTPRFWLDFWVSRNFLETAWRAMHSRQAAHIFLPIFGFLKRNHLAVNSQPLGDACLKTQFSGFWLSCPAVMNTRQATRAMLARFLCFLGSGKVLIGGKAVTANGCFDMKRCLISHIWRHNWMEQWGICLGW